MLLSHYIILLLYYHIMSQNHIGSNDVLLQCDLIDGP